MADREVGVRCIAEEDFLQTDFGDTGEEIGCGGRLGRGGGIALEDCAAADTPVVGKMCGELAKIERKPAVLPGEIVKVIEVGKSRKHFGIGFAVQFAFIGGWRPKGESERDRNIHAV